MDPSGIKYRQANEKDLDFLFHLHEATLKEYVARVWGWDPSWQEQHFKQSFDPWRYRIVVLNGEDVGVLVLEDHRTEIFLGLIEILPEYQNRGIGTAIVRSILAEGERRGVPVNLQVLKGNPARSLYERLGFVVATETGTHYQMQATPTRRAET